MNWIMNLSMNEICGVILGFCGFVVILKIVAAKLTEKYDEDYEEDED